MDPTRLTVTEIRYHPAIVYSPGNVDIIVVTMFLRFYTNDHFLKIVVMKRLVFIATYQDKRLQIER